MNVSLTPRLEALIREKVESGLYGNASEVVREALRLLEARDTEYQRKLDRLRAELAKGEEAAATGDVIEIRDEAALKRFFASLR